MPRLSTPDGMPQEVLTIVDVIGNHTRTEILHLLSAGVPMSAVELADQIGVNHSSIHRHLLVLEESGLVEADAPVGQRRGNKFVRWHLIPAAVTALGQRWIDYAGGRSPASDPS
jgi:DNA-binding transcriptional ArsR family regulator